MLGSGMDNQLWRIH
uniref:Uncharacterized protein n=1 Tax=Arundo donax TaxID=35708 RepID=A0A0A9AK11_ARUDO